MPWPRDTTFFVEALDAMEDLVVDDSAPQVRNDTLGVLRTIVDSLPVAAAILDTQDRVLACSQSFRRMAVPGKQSGDSFASFFEPEFNIDTLIADAMHSGASHQALDQRHKGYRLDIQIQPWRLPTTDIGGVFLTLSDCTEVRDGAQALQLRNQQLIVARSVAAERGEYLARLLDTLSAGVVVANESGHCTLWNAEAARLLGGSLRDVHASELAATFGLTTPEGDLVPDARSPLVQALAGKTIRDRLCRLRSPGTGLDRWLSISACPLGAQEPSAVCVISDISERIRTQQQLEEFAYVASHDLQEPARMVSSFVELLAEELNGQLSEECQEYVRFARDGATRMQRLIQDLLHSSRVGRRELKIEELDLKDCLQTAEAELGLDSHRELSVRAEALPRLRSDRRSMVQVFSNLLDNAFKFRDEARPLEVEVRAEEGPIMWHVRVRDNGIGVDPKYAEKAFQMFQRLHPRKHDGTGIGLALCKRIIERHGGQIEFEFGQAHGACIKFSIPKEGRERA